MPEAEVGNGDARPDRDPGWGALPMLTNRGDQTKNHVVLHVEHPTKPYQESRHPVLAMRFSLVCLAWSGVRLPFPTIRPFWLCLHSIVVLPIITGRGVKYTHNDISHLTLHTHSRRAGIRLVPEATAQEITYPYHQARPNQTDQDSWTVYDTIRRVNTVQDRWSSPHDHPMLGVRCDILHRSKLIW